MTDKELKRLTRSELLDELYNYANVNADLQLRLDNHQEEMRVMEEKLRAELDEAEERYRQLQKELENTRLLNRELSKKLSKRSIDLQDAGNIAEATLKITGFFEEAQKTAELYVQNVKAMAEEQEKILAELDEKSRADIQELGNEATKTCIAMRTQTEQECERLSTTTKAECERLSATTKAECERLSTTTKAECEQLRLKTEHDCDLMRKEAIAQAETYWQNLTTRLENFYNAHLGMRELLSESGISLLRIGNQSE